MKFRFKKLITVLIIIALLVPTTFFSLPKKADAVGAGLLACAMTAIFGRAADELKNLPGMIMSVPVHDASLNRTSSEIKQAAQSQNFKDCVLDAVVWDVANTLIKNITASTIEWINSGFDGSPSFVTDPEGFFTDVGDQIAGSWIEGLGPIGRILCSPFDLQIRLALGFGYLGRGDYYFTVRCRLSDVQKNIYNAFTGGQWGADGWQNWITISQPSNNAFGVYLQSSNDMMLRAAEKVGIQKTELSWGNGFRPFKKCKQDASGKKICESTTPGAVIETQLNNVIGAGPRKLEVADEINEIADALLNQLMSKIFSSAGLLGTSRSGSSYSSGRSYLSGLMSTYDSQIAQRDILPPQGISCNKTYRYVDLPLTTAGKTQFQVEQYESNGWWERDSNGKIVTDIEGNKICTETSPSNNPTAECPFYEIVTGVGQSGVIVGIDKVDFEQQVVQGCSNLSINRPTQDIVNSAAGEVGWGIPKEPESTAEASQSNLAINQETSASSVCRGGDNVNQVGYPKYGVDGQTDIFYKSPKETYTNFFGTKGSPGEWWQVTLNKPSTINYLKYFPGYNGYGDVKDEVKDRVQIYGCMKSSGVGNFKIEFFDSNGNIVKSTNSINITKYPTTDSVFIGLRNGAIAVSDKKSDLTYLGLQNVKSIKLTKNSGNKIENMDYNGLAFMEMEVYGVEKTTTDPVTTPTPGQTQSDARITSPDIVGIALREDSSLRLTDKLTIASSNDLPIMSIRISLNKKVGVSDLAPVNMNALFDELKILRAIQPGQIDFGYSNILAEYSDVETTGMVTDVPQTIPNVVIDETVPPQKINYLTIQLSTKNTLPVSGPGSVLGTYVLSFNIIDDGGKVVGSQNYSFTILPSTQ